MTPHPEHSAAVDLAPDVDRALAEFVEHLRLERGRSPHTVRAYRADLTGPARRPARAAGPRSRAAARAGWPTRTPPERRGPRSPARPPPRARSPHGRTGGDCCPAIPAPGWSPRGPDPPCPTVLDREQAAAVLDATGSRAGPDDPVAMRDRLVVELLYATGMRVAELCGLDLDDVDEQRRAVRVVGKGDRERTVVYGVPAGRALRVWRDVGSSCAGPTGVAARAAARCARRPPRPAGRPWRWCTGPWRPSRTSPTSARTAFGTRRRRTCSTAARTFVTYRSCSVTLSYRRLSSTRTSPSSG